MHKVDVENLMSSAGRERRAWAGEFLMRFFCSFHFIFIFFCFSQTTPWHRLPPSGKSAAILKHASYLTSFLESEGRERRHRAPWNRRDSWFTGKSGKCRVTSLLGTEQKT